MASINALKVMFKFISPEGLTDDDSVSLYTSRFVVSGKTIRQSRQ